MILNVFLACFRNLKACFPLTASTIEHEQEYYTEQGFDYFISKPFAFSTISDVLINLLKIKSWRFLKIHTTKLTTDK